MFDRFQNLEGEEFERYLFIAGYEIQRFQNIVNMLSPYGFW